MLTSKYVFLTSTMFSRNNGPASFSINLYELGNKKNDILFLTEDYKDSLNVIKVSPFYSRFPIINMLLKSIDYYNELKKIKYKIAIWNFSVLAWFSLIFANKKQRHIIFVNDPYSLDVKFKFKYRFIRLCVFRICEKYCVQNCELVITNSHIIKNKIVEQYDIPPNKVKVLYKGINFNQINGVKEDYSLPLSKKIKVSFVKSDFISGGLEYLCDSLKLLSEFHFEIKVIGPLRLDKFFYEYNNIEIDLTGRVSKDKVYQIVQETDFFCVPNKQEAFGQANIEALALQVPIVILPVNYQMALHDESYCWIPKNLETEALAEKIKELIQSTEVIRKNKALLGRKVVGEKYSLEYCLKSFESLIEI